MIFPKQFFNRYGLAASCLCLMTMSMPAHADTSNEDQTLIQNLQREQQLQESMPGLSGDDIRTLRKLLNEQEAARNNPKPPQVSNKINMIERGASPQIKIMDRFDTTVVFADRNGTPLEITGWRINDEKAAELIPIYSAVDGTDVQGLLHPTRTGEAQPAGEADDDRGPANAIIISPKRVMRSTNITVTLRGQSYPLVLTVSTKSTLDKDQVVAFIRELRLSWVSTMPKASALAGKFAGSEGGSALSGDLLTLVQGVPSGDLENIGLEGPLSGQVSLWRDATSDEPVWYLRMADYIEPMNVAISDRTRDGMRGFTVMRLNGNPPKVLGVTANGQYSSLTITGD